MKTISAGGASAMALVLCAILCAAATAADPGPAGPVATDDTTAPSAESQSAVDRRLAEEEAAKHRRFAVSLHKPNYILPIAWNRNPNEQFESLDPVEIKFQISFKMELEDDLFGTGGKLSFGYTQQSWWQAYNSDISSPFRETNYEPELMLGFVRPRVGDGLRNRGIVFGFVHQSNGGAQLRSRSWNRLYANFILEYGDFYFSLKPWYRIPEDEKSDPLDPSGDDNPDILDYMGYGEITALWVLGEHRLGLMLRNNLESDNKGAVQLDWSFPIRGRAQGYVQYFNGYGESLIDYNHSVNRLGIGVMLNNWL
jgi:phospholipase A1